MKVIGNHPNEHNNSEYLTLLDVMKRCRNAAFHIQKDTDRRKQTMDDVYTLFYGPSIENVYIKVSSIIERLKAEGSYKYLVK